MRRGDLMMAVLPGAYGKPRPVVIIQADTVAQPNSLTVLPLTDEITADETLRITIEASADNGLPSQSQVMINQTITIRTKRVSQQIGHLSIDDMNAVNRALAIFLGFA
jgi:mRNA interferase MazF